MGIVLHGAIHQTVQEKAFGAKVVSSNPSTEYWMDIFHIILMQKIVIFVWKRPTIIKKRPGMAHFEKLSAPPSNNSISMLQQLGIEVKEIRRSIDRWSEAFINDNLQQFLLNQLLSDFLRSICRQRSLAVIPKLCKGWKYFCVLVS